MMPYFKNVNVQAYEPPESAAWLNEEGTVYLYFKSCAIVLKAQTIEDAKKIFSDFDLKWHYQS